jgi:CRISPR system Cascade subunit CasA
MPDGISLPLTMDDWLYALVSLQTQEGFLGAGNYGVSRMNGGFASRPGLGLAPRGGLGARWARDRDILLSALGQDRPEWEGYDLLDGLGLVWLTPWDGSRQLTRCDLHPLYIEVCRRIRLEWREGGLAARRSGSKATRIFMAKEAGGATGDPWTPMSRGKTVKALTVASDGFTYRRLSDLLFGSDWSLPLLAQPAKGEKGPFTLVARALTRGQGKTEGLHERRVYVPAKVALRIFGQEHDAVGRVAKTRVDVIADLQQAFSFALRCLVQGAPDDVSAKASRNAFCEGVGFHIQTFADGRFFDDLWQEVEAEGEARDRARHVWMKVLFEETRRCLEAAGATVPLPSMRRFKARDRAKAVFEGAIRKKKTWLDFFERAAIERNILAQVEHERQEASV